MRTALALAFAALTLLTACGAGDPPEGGSRIDLSSVWRSS